MARPDKVAEVNEVAERFEAAAATVLTEYSGLSVADLAELRRQLRDSGAEYKIVKNTLTRLAARQAGVDVPDGLLTGPTAITFCADDPVAAAKVLKTFGRRHPGLVIKGGVVEGNVLDAAETSRLADLETREELLSKLAGMLGSVLAQPARLALANLEKAARLFAALQERKPAEAEASGEETAAPASADAEADTGDTEGDTAAEGDADAGAEGDAGAETATDASADAETAADASADAETAADASADAETAADASADAGAEGDADAETAADASADAEADTGDTEGNADAEGGGDAETDAKAD